MRARRRLRKAQARLINRELDEQDLNDKPWYLQRSMRLALRKLARDKRAKPE